MDKYRGMECEAQDQETKLWHKCRFIALSLAPYDMLPIVQVTGFAAWFVSWDRVRGLPKDELLAYYAEKPYGKFSLVTSEAEYRQAASSVICVTGSYHPNDWRILGSEGALIPVPAGCPVVPYFFMGDDKEREFLREKIVDTWVRMLMDISLPDSYALGGTSRATLQDIPASIVDRFADQESCDSIYEASLNPIRWCRTPTGPVGALWGSFVWVDGECVVPRMQDNPAAMTCRGMLIHYGLLKPM